MTWIIPGVVSVADMGDYYIFSNLRTETGEATSAKIYKYSATFVFIYFSNTCRVLIIPDNRQEYNIA